MHHTRVRGIQRPEDWLHIRPGFCAEGVPDCFLHVGVDVGKPHLRYWGCRLHRWGRWPVLAGLILRRSLRRELPVIPAPGRFGESGLSYRSHRLRRRRWRPVLASLLLNWSLRRDMPTDSAPSVRLDERLWGRQRNFPLVFLLMANILPYRPYSRLERNFLRLDCPR